MREKNVINVVRNVCVFMCTSYSEKKQNGKVLSNNGGYKTPYITPHLA